MQRSLSASAVFAEIMSIIKGSLVALRTQNGYLSRAEYMALPAKTGAVTGRQNSPKSVHSDFVEQMC